MVIDMELNYVGMGKRIANRRMQIGLKQIALSEMLGITNTYLSGIERGKEKPTLETFVKICNALHTTPDYFLMGNMYSNKVPQNIVDGLRLCSEDDLNLVATIIQYLVDRQGQKWNNDNFA